jgi:hypothetical protein
MNPEVHPGSIEPDKKRLSSRMLALDKIGSCFQKFQITDSILFLVSGPVSSMRPSA